MHQHRNRHDLEDNLIGGGVLVFAWIDAHRYTGSLDRFDGVVLLVVPPFSNFLQLLLQSVLFVLRKFQIFQPFLVLRLGQRGGLVVDKPLTDRARRDQQGCMKGQKMSRLMVVLVEHVQLVSRLVLVFQV